MVEAARQFLGTRFFAKMVYLGHAPAFQLPLYSMAVSWRKEVASYETLGISSGSNCDRGDHDSEQRFVSQRTDGAGGAGKHRVHALDVGLLLFNECATMVLRVVEMVLEPSTGVVPRLGWLGLGLKPGNGLALDRS